MVRPVPTAYMLALLTDRRIKSPHVMFGDSRSTSSTGLRSSFTRLLSRGEAVLSSLGVP